MWLMEASGERIINIEQISNIYIRHPQCPTDLWEVCASVDSMSQLILALYPDKDIAKVALEIIARKIGKENRSFVEMPTLEECEKQISWIRRKYR